MHTLKDAFEQRRLGPKVMVKGPGRHPRFKGEILDRRGGKTSLTEQSQPRRDECRPGLRHLLGAQRWADVFASLAFRHLSCVAHNKALRRPLFFGIVSLCQRTTRCHWRSKHCEQTETPWSRSLAT